MGDGLEHWVLVRDSEKNPGTDSVEIGGKRYKAVGLIRKLYRPPVV